MEAKDLFDSILWSPYADFFVLIDSTMNLGVGVEEILMSELSTIIG